MEELNYRQDEGRIPKDALIKLVSDEELRLKWLEENYQIIQQAFNEGEYFVRFGPIRMKDASAMRDYINQKSPEKYSFEIKGPLPTMCAFDPDTILKISSKI